MIVSFVKLLDADNHYTRWYLHDKLWRGDNKDLLLPSSLNCLIEEESSIAAKSISFPEGYPNKIYYKYVHDT